MTWLLIYLAVGVIMALLVLVYAVLKWDWPGIEGVAFAVGAVVLWPIVLGEAVFDWRRSTVEKRRASERNSNT